MTASPQLFQYSQPVDARAACACDKEACLLPPSPIAIKRPNFDCLHIWCPDCPTPHVVCLTFHGCTETASPYRFFPDLEWYTDVMITLIERAGEFSTKDIWHSTVQLITNNDDLHTYAATKVRAFASSPPPVTAMLKSHAAVVVPECFRPFEAQQCCLWRVVHEVAFSSHQSGLCR